MVTEKQKESKELQLATEREVTAVAFTEDADAALAAVVADRGVYVAEFIKAESESKHLSASGIVALHDRLIEDALATEDKQMVIVAVQSFGKMKYYQDQVYRSLERMYVAAKRAGMNPKGGYTSPVADHKDQREIASRISDADYEAVTRKAG